MTDKLDAERLAEIRRHVERYEAVKAVAVYEQRQLLNHIAYLDQQLAQAAEREGRYRELMASAAQSIDLAIEELPHGLGWAGVADIGPYLGKSIAPFFGLKDAVWSEEAFVPIARYSLKETAATLRAALAPTEKNDAE